MMFLLFLLLMMLNFPYISSRGSAGRFHPYAPTNPDVYVFPYLNGMRLTSFIFRPRNISSSSRCERYARKYKTCIIVVIFLIVMDIFWPMIVRQWAKVNLISADISADGLYFGIMQMKTFLINEISSRRHSA